MLFIETFTGQTVQEIDLANDEAAWQHANNIFDKLPEASSIWDCPYANGHYSIRIYGREYLRGDDRRMRTIYLLEKKRLNHVESNLTNS